MRQDLTKVFHEPGRHNIGWTKRNITERLIQRWGIESAPSHEPIRRDWDSTSKEKYSALRRFLISQVGHCWNDVYSDICHSVKESTLPGHALRYALDRLVAKHVRLIDGKPHDQSGASISGNYRPVWVHPGTGILMRSLEPVHPVHTQKRAYQQIKIDTFKKLVLINGLWFEVDFAQIPTEHNLDEPNIDIILGCAVMQSNGRASKCIAEWGADIYAVSKRSAGKKLIKRLTPKDSSQ